MLKLKDVLSVQSTTGGDGFMRAFIFAYIKDMPNLKVLQREHNIYITKGKAEFYPCVVAHLDTVHPIYKDYKIVKQKGTYYAFSGKKQVGTGGDDKCGIYVALRALTELEFVKVAFFHDEEIGCVGSGKAYMKWFDDVSLAMQADRRGADDIIFSAAGNTLASPDFIQMIKPMYQKYGFKQAFGSITDVQELKNRGLGVSCFNISAGYHFPHSDMETVVEAELMNTYDFMKLIMLKFGNKRQSHYEPKKSYGGWGYDDAYYWRKSFNDKTPYGVDDIDDVDVVDDEGKPYGFHYDPTTEIVEVYTNEELDMYVYDLKSADDEDNLMLDYPEYYNMIQKGEFYYFGV
jgi:tripeptide aminopeptidase